MRTCRVCLEPKALESDFYRVGRTRSTFRHVCKPCWLAMRRLTLSKQTLQQRQESIARARRWALANLDRVNRSWKAHCVLQRAMAKGLIARPSACESCGRACKPDAAHYDYERPLDIRWLCRSCHVRWDRAEPKTLVQPAQPTEAVA